LGPARPGELSGSPYGSGPARPKKLASSLKSGCVEGAGMANKAGNHVAVCGWWLGWLVGGSLVGSLIRWLVRCSPGSLVKM